MIPDSLSYLFLNWFVFFDQCHPDKNPDDPEAG
jgi:hypothetical protein